MMQTTSSRLSLLLAFVPYMLLQQSHYQCEAFSLVMMGRKKGNLNKVIAGEPISSKNANSGINSMNKGKGQEITGVTLPADGVMKGWEFGDQVTMACANVDGKFYAIQGGCPRCAFDLWKGDLITDKEAWEDTPRVACPTCSTTYSMNSGKYGPPMKRKGLAGFVNGLAKSATNGEKPLNAEAFQISLDEDSRVFCRRKNAR